jgi:molybdenum cofactor cytidylyltransferase
VIRALLLAAGASSRMGRPKAALPLGHHGTVLAAGVDALIGGGFPDVTIVSGAHPEAVRAASALRADRIHIVEHRGWQHGQLSSLLAGLDAIWSPELEAVAVLLVDVPLVHPETIRTVVDAWRTAHAPIVRPVCGDRHGHPVVFDAAVFEALRRADPEVGAKAVFAAHRERVLDVPVDDPWACDDLDTPEDYQRFLNAVISSPAEPPPG